jgi:sodium-dependent dicarboxylate transporter 2/3/5
VDQRGDPITGVVGLCLCVILNVASADDVFGSVFDSTILLFIGSFIIAEAMLVHGLDRRFAFNILALRWVGNSTHRIVIAFGFIGAATASPSAGCCCPSGAPRT